MTTTTEFSASVAEPNDGERYGGRTGRAADGKGMIAELANLVCARGHRSYAPEPQEWLEHRCERENCGARLRALY